MVFIGDLVFYLGAPKYPVDLKNTPAPQAYGEPI